MSLVFAAITPHLPGLLEDSQLPSLAKIQEALKELEGELYVMQPDVLFIISPLAPMAKDAFLINLANNYIIDLPEQTTELLTNKYSCDIELVSKLREYADSHAYGSANIINQTVLDHGSAVPLYALAKHLPHVRVVPISLSLGTAKEHYRFGHVLRHVAGDSNKRIAIIGSLQLSMRHQATVNPEADTYDKMVLDSLHDQTLDKILKINASIVDSAQAIYSQKVLAMLLGTFGDMQVAPKVLTYQQAKGASHVVVQFTVI